MTEFRKQYQNEPVDFHLWSQDKIAEFWWKAGLEWIKYAGVLEPSLANDLIDEELEG